MWPWPGVADLCFANFLSTGVILEKDSTKLWPDVCSELLGCWGKPAINPQDAFIFGIIEKPPTPLYLDQAIASSSKVDGLIYPFGMQSCSG